MAESIKRILALSTSSISLSMYVLSALPPTSATNIHDFLDYSRHTDPHSPPQDLHPTRTSNPARKPSRILGIRKLRSSTKLHLVAKTISGILHRPTRNEVLRVLRLQDLSVDNCRRGLGTSMDGRQRTSTDILRDAILPTRHERPAILHHRWIY